MENKSKKRKRKVHTRQEEHKISSANPAKPRVHRGRPEKPEKIEVEKTPKKRGRPRKIIENAEPKVPKKRGRKPKAEKTKRVRDRRKDLNDYIKKIRDIDFTISRQAIKLDNIHEQINIVTLQLNPEFKHILTDDYFDRYSKKINDLRRLQIKLIDKQISEAQFKRQVAIKDREIASIEKEISSFSGKNVPIYTANLVAYQMYTAIEYKYPDELGLGDENDIIKNLPYERKVEIMEELYAIKELRNIGVPLDEFKRALRKVILEKSA